MHRMVIEEFDQMSHNYPGPVPHEYVTFRNEPVIDESGTWLFSVSGLKVSSGFHICGPGFVTLSDTLCHTLQSGLRT